MGELNSDKIRELRKLICNVLNQGDSRYNDPEAEKILAFFIEKEAISIREKEIPKIKKPEERILRHFVQNDEKNIAEILLKINGFNEQEIFFERRFFGYVPDVLAEKEGFIILVECCSCRVSKIIDYLPYADEIWVLTRGEDPWEEKPLSEKMQWFVFKKAGNWGKVYSEFNKKRTEELKRIPSPIDDL